jgi:putative ABC transport system ATP-binding protein
MGGSGAGKTLFLRSLALLETWDKGSLRWLGRPVEDGEVPSFRSQVIYLHQRPALEDGTVEENLRAVFRFKTNRARAFDRPGIQSYLARIGFESSFLGKPARLLSGGEGQVVSLLRAVQLNPRALLLDEPTAALDAEKARAVEEIVFRWFGEAPPGKAYIWVCHQKEQAARISSRILMMERGCLQDLGDRTASSLKPPSAVSEENVR